MEIVNLSREQILYMLFSGKQTYQGSHGLLYQQGDYLFKLNYSIFMDAYITRKEKDFDRQIEYIKEELGKSENFRKLYDPMYWKVKYRRLEETKSNNLITGILVYEGIYVGTQMNYFEDYVTLIDLYKNLPDDILIMAINQIKELSYDLVTHNIVPGDLSTRNILFNPKTNDVVLIDLDDRYTQYADLDYVTKYGRKIFNKAINDMVDTMLNKDNKKMINVR